MNYNTFIKTLQDTLNENGLRISQDNLKKIFDTMAEVILDNIGEEENIKIREFIMFRLITVKERKLPNGTTSKEQLGVKVELSNTYKNKLKERLNK